MIIIHFEIGVQMQNIVLTKPCSFLPEYTAYYWTCVAPSYRGPLLL